MCKIGMIRSLGLTTCHPVAVRCEGRLSIGPSWISVCVAVSLLRYLDFNGVVHTCVNDWTLQEQEDYLFQLIEACSTSSDCRRKYLLSWRRNSPCCYPW